MVRRLFQKKHETPDRGSDFQIVLDIVKRFDKKEFNRFWDGIKKSWEGYDMVFRAQTREEKETKPVDDLENSFIEQEANDK